MKDLIFCEAIITPTGNRWKRFVRRTDINDMWKLGYFFMRDQFPHFISNEMIAFGQGSEDFFGRPAKIICVSKSLRIYL
ncbi:MAG: hypothetical protein BGO55_11300 [Sphingobacteriales bacterium 50-39]|nr:MAG: hypothetical protein BGO55_11300 [Sphingobacteriales bacterium 50-39]